MMNLISSYKDILATIDYRLLIYDPALITLLKILIVGPLNYYPSFHVIHFFEDYIAAVH